MTEWSRVEGADVLLECISMSARGSSRRRGMAGVEDCTEWMALAGRVG